MDYQRLTVKKLLIGALTAVLLIGSISIVYMFVKADAETVVAAEEETEDIDETISEMEESKEDMSEKNDIEESGENEMTESEEADEEFGEDTGTDETKSGDTELDKTKAEETEEAKFEEADTKDNNAFKADNDVLAVQALIDALSPVGEVKAMDLDGQRTAYDQTQEAYDAYKELSEEQRELITGVEAIYELFDFFNSQIMPLSDQNMEMNPIDGTGQLSIPFSSVLW